MAVNKPPKPHYHHALHAPLWLALLVVTLFSSAGFSQLNTAHQTTIVPKKIVASTGKATPASAAPTPSTPQPAPAPVVTPAPVKHKVIPSAAKPQPVVTPAPTADVSGLTPTTPAPDTSSSGSSSSSSSSPATTTGYYSTNWSGYLATNSTFSAVSGSWIVPHALPVGATTTVDSSWIGIGGVTSGDLIQTGTDNTVSPDGTVTSEAWYELLPAVSQPIASLTVNPGDSMSASITELSAGQWSISITDNTTGQTFGLTVAYSSSKSSAEWIEEDPSFASGRQIPFDNFQTATFASGSTVMNGTRKNLLTVDALPVTMLNRHGVTIATPSQISADGSSFAVARNGL